MSSLQHHPVDVDEQPPIVKSSASIGGTHRCQMLLMLIAGVLIGAILMASVTSSGLFGDRTPQTNVANRLASLTVTIDSSESSSVPLAHPSSRPATACPNVSHTTDAAQSLDASSTISPPAAHDYMGIAGPSLVSKSSTFTYELSAGTMFASGDPLLIEWVEYNLMLGVQHFWLYEHIKDPAIAKSAQPTPSQESLRPYVDLGQVSYERIDGENFIGLQMMVWSQMVSRARGVTRWLMLMDVDEFVVPKNTDSIPTLLIQYDKYAGVSLHWQQFGTSRVASIDPKTELVTETLRWRAPATGYDGDPTVNAVIKTIIQPKRIDKCTNPHICVPISPYTVVNTHFVALSPYVAQSQPIHSDVVQLNHYFTRDEDFLRRYKIGWRQLNPTDSNQKWMQYRVTKMMDEYDTTIQRFMPELRRRMQLTPLTADERARIDAKRAQKPTPYTQDELTTITTPP